MTSTRRALATVLAVLAVLVLGTAAAAYALRAGPVPQSVQREHRFWADGPTVSYGSNYGSISAVHPLFVEVPADAEAYDAVVTVSFEYRTSGRAPFTMSAGAQGVDERPGRRPLPAREQWTSATMQFLLPSLEAGKRYRFSPGPSATPASGAGENRIYTRRVLMTVDLTPA